MEHWSWLPVAVLPANAVFHLASDVYARAHAPDVSVAPSDGRVSMASRALAVAAPDDSPGTGLAVAPVDPRALPGRIVVFTLDLYVALRIAGLTRLAPPSSAVRACWGWCSASRSATSRRSRESGKFARAFVRPCQDP